jgi:hypothetical protein
MSVGIAYGVFDVEASLADIKGEDSGEEPRRKRKASALDIALGTTEKLLSLPETPREFVDFVHDSEVHAVYPIGMKRPKSARPTPTERLRYALVARYSGHSNQEAAEKLKDPLAWVNENFSHGKPFSATIIYQERDGSYKML